MRCYLLLAVACLVGCDRGTQQPPVNPAVPNAAQPMPMPMGTQTPPAGTATPMATAPAPEFETPDFELDAGALSKEIAADANKSLEKYGQKKVRLTGIVSLAVTENKFSRIEFKGDGAAIVLCRLYGGNDDAVARMKPGQTVTVQGEFGTLGENFPHLYFCQIVKQ